MAKKRNGEHQGGETETVVNLPEKFQPPSLLALDAALPVSAAAEAVAGVDEEAGGDRAKPPGGLPIIKIDHSEGRFLLPSGELHDTIEGHIIHWFGTKKWWKDAYKSGEHKPPDCWSANGIEPHASSVLKQAPVCGLCKHNLFGSHRAGTRAKDCADVDWIFLLNPAFGAPPINCLLAGPSSLSILNGGQFKSGLMQQMEARFIRYELGWVRLGLEPGGERHYVIVPEILGATTLKEEAKKLGALKHAFKVLMDDMRAQTSTVPALGLDPSVTTPPPPG